ncbi:cytochrome-c peroxidase [Sanyastnella coralliicola]|uniref:cytochrome-c peroxidase n=1 Tax=Sanyastnella coralliicola TaxID=3069118 RepID=UPI0027B92E7E|nr:cytochrome c peroxidase [Longitalea sp. SCSIO 12813]
MRSLLAVCAVVILIAACKKDKEIPSEEQEVRYELVLPEEPFDYAYLGLPDHVANNTQLNVYAANNEPSGNPITNEGATLGRVLFYDRALSVDNTMSCASCHQQAFAFTDPRQFSIGVHGDVTRRNSMSLLNMRYFRDFFWDMSADGLEAQVLMPIVDPTEMDQDLESLLVELSETEHYPALFEAAFGDPEITTDRISRAMAQFIRSIVSFDTKFDDGVPTNFANFNEQETLGKDLFYSGEFGCNQCHNSYNFFTRLEPANNGLETMTVDSGYYVNTGNPDHIGMFKIVSLRNVEVTGPYMHDGRFATLEEVMDHYSDNLQAHPNLDERLTTGTENGDPPLQMNLTDEEKQAMIAFMKTLTDHAVMQDLKFSDPFVVLE